MQRQGNSAVRQGNPHRLEHAIHLDSRTFGISLDLILTLTGSRATLPVVYSSTFGTSTALSPFYLDTYGSDDVGITIGRPLHLNTHILNATLDAWLSGDWLQYLEE